MNNPGNGGSGGSSGGGDPPPGEDVGRLFSDMNRERERVGVQALLWSNKIASVAQNYAEYCAPRRTYSPTLNGTPASRLRAGGVSSWKC